MAKLGKYYIWIDVANNVLYNYVEVLSILGEYAVVFRKEEDIHERK